MKDGPNIALIGSLIGDPARANMLTALMSGKALTASELAVEAGITPQTASSHLARLTDAGFVVGRSQGRHRYYALADADVAASLESLMGLAAKKGLLRTRTGPKDAELRHARVCYNHLAGDLGVHVYDSMIQQGLLVEDGTGELDLSENGEAFLESFGAGPLRISTRQPRCRSCLDWSERRFHLAGSAGRALLTRFQELGWAKIVDGTRLVRFSREGEQALFKTFPVTSAGD
jgi:DNA-binding transcriptional ArsR family regulator